ncbi:hypothetical protein [Kibdelosporangium phytohabitans]|uniref:Uncharacterized protein n=1 Tax=Kibdelosporangium phytohabitans TaxID=860235 RepID=A0A0N9HTC2_9PSEU|nr:hypothetical protein [Kibdelosporangium phytohabitans]ALG08344.1 hypothetical protein AOZ06_16775 [Kibdelosporangium phytohabitans]MBE1470620.1 hypothetical protein [Kibdelosporangium phytohabitans]
MSTQSLESGDTGSSLARRYRKLLGLYPRDHREKHGDEMLGVLLAGAGKRSRPSARDIADLLWAALRLHLRRVVAADGGIDHRDVLAVVSLLGPVAILAGATTGLHELAWWIESYGFVDGLIEIPWRTQFPDAPVWLVWLAVAVLGVLRMRRAAAAGAWLGVAGFFWLMFFGSSQHLWYSMDAGWVELGAVTAVALTWSPGSARGRELVGKRGIVVLASAVAAAVLCGVVGYRENVAEFLLVALPIVGAVLACVPRSRAGRRAALVLSLPAMPIVLWQLLLPGTGLDVRLAHAPDAVEAAVYLGVPLLVLLVLGGLRPRRGQPAT